MPNSSQKIEELLTKAERLESLRSQIIEIDVFEDPVLLQDSLIEFYEVLKAIKTNLIGESAIPINEDDYESRRKELELLQKVSTQEEFPEVGSKKGSLFLYYLITNSNIDQSDLDGLDFRDQLLKQFDHLSEEEKKEINELGNIGIDLSWDELNDLADEHYFPAFSQYEYINNIMEVGVLIAKIDSLPEHLHKFVKEVKKCYGFQRYLAVVALSRTMIEISIRDLYNLNHFNDKDSWQHERAIKYFRKKKGKKWEKYIYEFDPTLADMTNILCSLPQYENFKDEINNLKAEMNRVIHGRATVKQEKAKETLADSLNLLSKLYAV